VGDVPRVVGIGGGSPADHQTGWAVEIRNKQPGEPSEKIQKTDGTSQTKSREDNPAGS
jgi:hypothetical protein